LKRFPILLVVLMALFVTACASDDGASDAPSEASATVEPTPTEEPEPSGSSLALPSIGFDSDPELASRFPDTVGGLALAVQSVSGDAFAAQGGTDPAFQSFLDSVGAELSDVSVAFGGASDPSDPATALTVGAFRVRGADEDDLEREFVAASELSGDATGLEAASIAGKDVLTATDPTGQTDRRVFIYTKGDTLYFVTGTEDQAAEILGVLP